MSNFYGADVAALRALAARFGAAADRLAGTCSEVNSAVVIAQRWEGPDAHEFREGWHSFGRASLSDAEASLREASRMLLANADEQERASGAGGGGAIPGGIGTMPTPTWWSTLPFPIDGGFPPGFGGFPDVEDIFRPLLPFFPENPLKSWPALPGDPGEIHRWIAGVDNWLDGETSIPGMDWRDLIGHLPRGGDFSEVIGIADIAFDPDRSGWDKGFDLGSMVTHRIGDEMMLAAPGSPAWWGGLAVHTWTDVVNDFRAADFSQEQFARNLDFVMANPGALVDSVGHAGIEVFDRVSGYVGVGWVGDLLTQASEGANFSPQQVADSAAYALQHPDVALQEVGTALSRIGSSLGERAVESAVSGVLDKIKFW